MKCLCCEIWGLCYPDNQGFLVPSASAALWKVSQGKNMSIAQINKARTLVSKGAWNFRSHGKLPCSCSGSPAHPCNKPENTSRKQRKGHVCRTASRKGFAKWRWEHPLYKQLGRRLTTVLHSCMPQKSRWQGALQHEEQLHQKIFKILRIKCYRQKGDLSSSSH